MVDHRSLFLRCIQSHSLSTETKHEIKEEDPSIQGCIRYPATLMIKRSGGAKRLKRNFNLILC